MGIKRVSLIKCLYCISEDHCSFSCPTLQILQENDEYLMLEYFMAKRDILKFEKFKHKFCRYFLQGKCKKKQCKFIHSSSHIQSLKYYKLLEKKLITKQYIVSTDKTSSQKVKRNLKFEERLIKCNMEQDYNNKKEQVLIDNRIINNINLNQNQFKNNESLNSNKCLKQELNTNPSSQFKNIRCIYCYKFGHLNCNSNQEQLNYLKQYKDKIYIDDIYSTFFSRFL